MEVFHALSSEPICDVELTTSEYNSLRLGLLDNVDVIGSTCPMQCRPPYGKQLCEVHDRVDFAKETIATILELPKSSIQLILSTAGIGVIATPVKVKNVDLGEMGLPKLQRYTDIKLPRREDREQSLPGWNLYQAKWIARIGHLDQVDLTRVDLVRARSLGEKVSWFLNIGLKRVQFDPPCSAKVDLRTIPYTGESFIFETRTSPIIGFGNNIEFGPFDFIQYKRSKHPCCLGFSIRLQIVEPMDSMEDEDEDEDEDEGGYYDYGVIEVMEGSSAYAHGVMFTFK